MWSILPSNKARLIFRFAGGDRASAQAGRSAPGALGRPGRLTWLALALPLACCPYQCAPAEPSPINDSSRLVPYRLTHLAFDLDGRLIRAPAPLRTVVSSLYYGEAITNVVFTEEWGRAADTNPKGLPGSAPARPARPQYGIDRWTSEHGLPANKVNALLQTRDGYLWIGTVGGLARFDGVRLTAFDESNTPEMKINGSVMRALWEDSEGKLWIGTDRGVLCYSGGRFVQFEGQEQVRGKHVRCLASRAAGGFWFGGDQGIGYQDGSGAHWCGAAWTERTNSVVSLVEGPGGILWAGTTRGLFGFDRATHVVRRSFLTEGSVVPVGGLMLDRQQRLWIGSGQGVWRLDGDESKLIPMGETGRAGLSTAHNARFAEDTEGNVWATTARGGGMICFRRDGNRFDFEGVAPEISETTCVLQDREGAIWVGGQYHGLSRLRRQLFATLTFVGDGMLDNFRSVTEGADGSLWFASRAGIVHWAGHRLTLFDARLFEPRRISSICVEPSVWVGPVSVGRRV
jgi:ligand-binding sensor domain-containing protein